MATVLLTGAGGVAVPSVIEHLRDLGHRVIACDMDKHAAGLYFADKGYIIPHADSPEFLPALRRVCQQERVQVAVPLVDEEILSALELEQDGIHVLAPRAEFVALCRDKWKCMAALRLHRIGVPRTYHPYSLSIQHRNYGLPLIAKPRAGRGSRGIELLNTHDDVFVFATGLGELNTYIFQEYIDGQEYTVSVVVWRDGEVQAVVPKEIICKQGMTRLAVTRRNDKIDALCRRIQDELRADGPFNVQLRLGENGEPYVFEINPRFSGTTNLTLSAGCDEVGGLIQMAMGDGADFGCWRDGIVLVRRYADSVMDESVFRRCEVNDL